MPPRDRAVLRVLVIVLLVNLAGAVAKLVVGAIAGSLALLADGGHGLLDASSNVVGIIGLWIAAKPPDAGHPYGHRRFESIAAAIIGLLIVGGLLTIADAVISAVLEGRPGPRFVGAATAVTATTVVVNLAISRYERRRGRELKSTVLVADASHTLSDALGASVVLCSFAGQALGLRWADLAATAIVCGIIAHTAWSVLSTNLSTLADAVRIDPAEIERVVRSVPGVRGTHQIRSRGYGDQIHLDLHIQLDPKITLEAAHDKTHEVIAAIRRAHPNVVDVLIHTEPDTPSTRRP
jgi:cation diffusion facilitator family transporter